MHYQKDDLKRAAYHIAFEMYHFQAFARMCQDRQMGRGLQRQAFEYSLLLHLRVLLDFFYGLPKHDDVSVKHFSALSGFTTVFPPECHAPPTAARDLSKNLNKRLAHFTATRWKEPHPEMGYYAQYFADIHRLIQRFELALPEEVQLVFRERIKVFEKRDKRDK